MDRRALELRVGRLLLAALVWWGVRRLDVGPDADVAPMAWNRRQLVVAAAQWDMHPAQSVGEFTARVTAVMDEAHHVGAALVVFPEDLGLSLLGLLTRYGGPRSTGELGAEEVRAYLGTWGPVVAPLFEETFRRAAAAYGMVVVAGSSYYRRRQQVVNQGVVFGPDGRLLLRQPKLHLITLEETWGVEPGHRFDRPEGLTMPLGVAICHDASFFETYRMAEALGVEVMAVPAADPDPDWSEPKARRGAWARTQETGMASVVAAGTGELYGVRFSGKAGIYIPRELTSDMSGVVSESARPDTEGVVVGSLDLDQLAAFRQEARPRPSEAAVKAWLFPRYRALTLS